MARRDTHTGGRDATRAVIPGRVCLSVGDPGIPAPSGFRWRPLTELARLESGHTPARSHPEYWDGDIPWIGIPDASANHGRRLTDTEQHVTQTGIDNSSARILPADTVCLSRTASVGYVVTMGVPMATSQDFVNWVCGPELNHRYLHFALMLEQEAIRTRFAHGSTHATMYYPEAKALHVLLPSRTAQDAIAEVLGALDDKIAANDHLCTLVDQLAEAQFRDRSRRVGLQDTTYVDIAHIGGGGTPRTGERGFWDGPIRWASPTDITALRAPYLDHTAKGITEEGLAACSSPLYPTMSVLMTSRATIGAFAMAMAPTAVNQGFIVARPKEPAGAWWLFHEMRSRVDDYVAQANGATFLELPRGRFKAMNVAWPATEELEAFHAVVAPLHQRAYAAMVESRRLAALRDALLPELMSGRLRVKDAESTVEEVL